jgi:hypothetical protein
MAIVETLSHYMANPSPDEDGQDHGTSLLARLPEDAIRGLEEHYGCSFNHEVRDLLRFCGGLINGPMEMINFTGSDGDPGVGWMTGRVREIASDGFGNFWFLWLPHVNEKLGPIYYFQHELPAILLQSHGIVEFVTECVKLMTPPYKSLIDDVHEMQIGEHAWHIQKLKPAQDLSVVSDPALADFLSTLPDDAGVYDFRSSKIGDGIDLSRFNIVAVHDTLPVMAVQKHVGVISRFLSYFSKS